MVSVAVCYVPDRNTVAAGSGIVDAVGGAIITPVGDASRIVPC